MIQKQQHRKKALDETISGRFKGKTEVNLADIRESIEALKKMKAGTYNEQCMCYAGTNEFLRFFGSMTKLKTKKGKR